MGIIPLAGLTSVENFAANLLWERSLAWILSFLLTKGTCTCKAGCELDQLQFINGTPVPSLYCLWEPTDSQVAAEGEFT